MNEIIRMQTRPTNTVAMSVAALALTGVAHWQAATQPLVSLNLDSGTRGTIVQRPVNVIPAPVASFEHGVATVYEALLASQEPLGAEFESIWDANVGRLYES